MIALGRNININQVKSLGLDPTMLRTHLSTRVTIVWWDLEISRETLVNSSSTTLHSLQDQAPTMILET
jgi:hypothetical protein